jgi:sulfoxide reductase heme-binding subunit YedZ
LRGGWARQTWLRRLAHEALTVTTDQFLWVLARVAGLGSYAALAVAVVTGIALRTAVLDWLGNNRALRSLHEYTTVLWIPLAGIHLGALVLDSTARIGLLDLVVPFRAAYGTLAIGLGALAVDLLLVVTITALLRRHIRPDIWKWLHRLAYAAFALIFFHAVLSGTDFSDPVVSAVSWGTAAALLALGLARAVWGRLPA